MRAVHECSSNSRCIMDRITLSNNKASHDRVKNYLRMYEGTKVRKTNEGTFVPSCNTVPSYVPSFVQ